MKRKLQIMFRKYKFFQFVGMYLLNAGYILHCKSS
jgi:hypothetical protein